jgi:hypothetical protein
VGAGAFADYGNSLGSSLGVFGTAGAMAGKESAIATNGDDKATVFGGYAGAGLGLFVTNGTSAEALGGAFETKTLNVGLGINIGLSLAYDRTSGVFMLAATPVGPGAGLSVSEYNTWTVSKDLALVPREGTLWRYYPDWALSDAQKKSGNWDHTGGNFMWWGIVDEPPFPKTHLVDDQKLKDGHDPIDLTKLQ